MKIKFFLHHKTNHRQFLFTLGLTASLLGDIQDVSAALAELALRANPPTRLIPSSSAQSARLAHLVLFGTQQESMDAIGSLRKLGPPGLDALFEANATGAGRDSAKDGAIAQAVKKIVPPSGPPPAAQSKLLAKGALASRRFLEAVDQVGQQKDCCFSHLYWYTDLEQAQEAAVQTGKPILSLWMLGKLNEEYSCANSRFFRTILYSNLEVSRFLRQHFVLHWHSVRPVPRITIDFGDGRSLDRTITGNSIHYVLDEQGRPLDALPGLYTPDAFLRELRRSLHFLNQANEPISLRPFSLQTYHQARLTEIDGRIEQAFGPDARYVREMLAEKRQADPAPANATLTSALPRALSKSRVERPMVAALTRPSQSNPGPQNDDLWLRLGKRLCDERAIDPNSESLIREKYSEIADANQPEAWARIFRNLQETVTADTYWNEFVLRPRIHEWFAANQLGKALGDLNEFVYSELFLTPSADPWLGLAHRDIFSGLPRACPQSNDFSISFVRGTNAEGHGEVFHNYGRNFP